MPCNMSPGEVPVYHVSRDVDAKRVVTVLGLNVYEATPTRGQLKSKWVLGLVTFPVEVADETQLEIYNVKCLEIIHLTSHVASPCPSAPLVATTNDNWTMLNDKTTLTLYKVTAII